MKIAFLLYPDVTLLDFAGPAQILARLKGVSLHFVAKTKDLVTTDAGCSVLPTDCLSDLQSADILCVPGGLSSIDVMEDEEIISWVTKIGVQCQWVTSVCSGSMILAAAGLKGYRATSHWVLRDDLALFGAIPTEGRVVFDRNRVTGGGVTAGIDFGFALSAAIQGDDHAKLIQLEYEYDPTIPLSGGTPATAEKHILAQAKSDFEHMLPNHRERSIKVAERLSLKQ
ncbi:DJ-1/PfpI family protein [Xenorhabdus sp. PB30.3]|uniref:DJ-1/PfpI family protein n=1 Tax=Xenorhabdus sp. PB30.3 TaxID=2788941 RepID=UPI001E394E12|nr:DJ-1/PfpI family protein [Xenorhabdus sp. PB30.3]MCC8379179.1 DJ-1/PfpI family protein [Xenorhabdus sp. PB30.3]